MPSTIEISNSSETSFFLDQDTECVISNGSFSCGFQYLEEETLGATIEISNQMEGTIIDAQNIDVLFSVELLSCSDSWATCAGMELVLPLPCLVELETDGRN